MITVGQQFDKYRLIRLLGQGAFADVYLGEHVTNNTLAAVKVLKMQLAQLTSDQKEAFIKNFINEASSAFSLKHPNIIQLLGFGIERKNDIPFLVMTYAPNGSLRQCHPKGERLPLTTIVTYVKQIAAALQFAHDQQLIHRDVKPENLLLGANNEVLLSDFGLVTVASQTTNSNTQNPAGTALYMAPEQFRGKPCISSDQYALGVVVYEWLCGEYPFHGNFIELCTQHLFTSPPPLSKKIQDIHPKIEKIIMKALAKKPEQRYASVEDFADALEQVSKEQQKRLISKQTSVKVPALMLNKQAPEIAVAPLRPNKSGFLPPRPLTLTHPTIVLARDNVDSTIDSPEKVIQLPATPQPALSPNIQKSENTSPSFSKKYKAVLLIGLAFLIMFGSIGFLSRSVIKSQQPSPVTATPSVTMPITLETGMFGFDAQHTHFNSSVNTLNPANVSSLALYWKDPTGGSIYSSPVVVNGVIYVGSDNGKLYAFSASTGQTLWKATTGDSIESSPAVVDGIVYVGSFDHKLYAFDANTGKPLWTALTRDVIFSSPVVADGIIYIGSNDGKLYAFSASGCGSTSCSPLWTASTGGPIKSSPAVANGIVYVGSLDHKLYAFDTGTGATLWTAATRTNNVRRFHTFPMETGTTVWAKPTGGKIYSSPAIADGVVYVGSDDHTLYAFDAYTGELLRSATAGGAIGSSPAIANGVVYVGANDGRLYAFDTSGCGDKKMCLRWRTTPIGHQIISPPMVANGVVYVGSWDGKVYAFGANGGTFLNTWTTGASIASQPFVANGIVYVSSFDGWLYAFHLPSLLPTSKTPCSPLSRRATPCL